MKFAYLPVTGIPKKVTIAKDFFQQIASQLKGADNQAEEMISAFENFLDKDQVFNVSALATFLKNLSMAKVLPENSLQPSGNPKHLKEIGNRPAHLNVSPAMAQAQQQDLREDPGTVVLDGIDFSNPNSMPEQVAQEFKEEVEIQTSAPQMPSIPQPSDIQTSASNQVQPQPAPEPKMVEVTRYRLTHIASGKSSFIEGKNFTVGKSKRAKMQVKHTSTVSRIHAVLTCDETGCYIQDNKSLNGTFVNDQQLEPGVKVLVNAGDEIRMSDEDFTLEAISSLQEV